MICNFNVFPSFKLDKSRSSSSSSAPKTLGFVDNEDDPTVLFRFLNQKFREEVIGFNRVELLLA